MAKYKRQNEEDYGLSYSEELAQQQEAQADGPEPVDSEDATYKKRYGDLRRHQQQLLQQKDEEVAQLRKQLDQAAKGQIKFPKSDEEIEQWSKKYPDVAQIVDTIARKRANEALEEGDKRMDSLRSLEKKLTKREAKAAARAIDLYKADTGKRKTTSKSAAQDVGRLSRSAPTANQRAEFSESMVNSMSDSEFEKNAEAIQEAIRSGKFSYDISGAAR
jgi:hypothetical protein